MFNKLTGPFTGESFHDWLGIRHYRSTRDKKSICVDRLPYE